VELATPKHFLEVGIVACKGQPAPVSDPCRPQAKPNAASADADVFKALLDFENFFHPKAIITYLVAS
jgi:hypothetical protein